MKIRGTRETATGTSYLRCFSGVRAGILSQPCPTTSCPALYSPLAPPSDSKQTLLVRTQSKYSTPPADHIASTAEKQKPNRIWYLAIKPRALPTVTRFFR